MMLLVESDLALAVGRFCLAACRRNRPSATVNDCDFGRESDPSTARPDRRAKVDVLRVHEVALVQQADSLGVSAPNQQACAADPIRKARPPCHPLDRFRDQRDSAVVSAHQDLLSKLVERTDHRTDDNSARPPSSTSLGPTTDTVVSLCRMPRSWSTACGSTIVSLFNSRRCSPVLARMPILVPRAKPRLFLFSITPTSAHARAAAALSSLERLSTTMISCDATGGGS